LSGALTQLKLCKFVVGTLVLQSLSSQGYNLFDNPTLLHQISSVSLVGWVQRQRKLNAKGFGVGLLFEVD